MQKFLLLFVILGLSVFSTNVNAQTPVPENYGTSGALSDESITLEEALVYGIQDEYLARARYSAVIQKFGSIRPFSNIRVSEEKHISTLLPLFQKYNVKVPEDVAMQYISEPATLKEAFQQGVDGELANIAMYEKMIAIPALPQDVKSVFTYLRDASKNHLRAFRRGLSRQQ